jgi:uncharacterized cupredoxin-like copper-binding protein
VKLKALLMVSVLAFVAVACSDSTEDGASGTDPGTQTGMPSMDMGGTESFDFGRPGDPADADRTVEITQLDTFRFEPSDVALEMGETVTFNVTNDGQTPHEFVLGDEMFQQEHASEMQDMGGELMPDEPNAITVQPGETKSLTWTFAETGTLEFGCHVPGHFAQGMVGTIEVSS